VLYVEDNPANLFLVEQICEHLSKIKLISAHTGDLGLAVASSSKPDLILLDINLPGLNGFEVLHRLRSQESTADIPILALSANAMPIDIQKGRDEGFDDYITKPIEVKKLLTVLNEYLTD
ncbi:MAG: response regulator, partial [Gammaproteobacteria bacterium]|nr:response regulator [Gammaproteobacteria bacterium]